MLVVTWLSRQQLSDLGIDLVSEIRGTDAVWSVYG